MVGFLSVACVRGAASNALLLHLWPSPRAGVASARGKRERSSVVVGRDPERNDLCDVFGLRARGAAPLRNTGRQGAAKAALMRRKRSLPGGRDSGPGAPRRVERVPPQGGFAMT